MAGNPAFARQLKKWYGVLQEPGLGLAALVEAGTGLSNLQDDICKRFDDAAADELNTQALAPDSPLFQQLAAAAPHLVQQHLPTGLAVLKALTFARAQFMPLASCSTILSTMVRTLALLRKGVMPAAHACLSPALHAEAMEFLTSGLAITTLCERVKWQVCDLAQATDTRSQVAAVRLLCTHGGMAPELLQLMTPLGHSGQRRYLTFCGVSPASCKAWGDEQFSNLRTALLQLLLLRSALASHLSAAAAAAPGAVAESAAPGPGHARLLPPETPADEGLPAGPDQLAPELLGDAAEVAACQHALGQLHAVFVNHPDPYGLWDAFLAMLMPPCTSLAKGVQQPKRVLKRVLPLLEILLELARAFGARLVHAAAQRGVQLHALIQHKVMNQLIAAHIKQHLDTSSHQRLAQSLLDLIQQYATQWENDPQAVAQQLQEETELHRCCSVCGTLVRPHAAAGSRTRPATSQPAPGRRSGAASQGPASHPGPGTPPSAAGAAMSALAFCSTECQEAEESRQRQVSAALAVQMPVAVDSQAPVSTPRMHLPHEHAQQLSGGVPASMAQSTQSSREKHLNKRADTPVTGMEQVHLDSDASSMQDSPQHPSSKRKSPRLHA